MSRVTRSKYEDDLKFEATAQRMAGQANSFLATKSMWLYDGKIYRTDADGDPIAVCDLRQLDSKCRWSCVLAGLWRVSTRSEVFKRAISILLTMSMTYDETVQDAIRFGIGEQNMPRMLQEFAKEHPQDAAQVAASLKTDEAFDSSKVN